jgi:hypothetical protein
MFLGAYWAQRKESRDQVAARIAIFLDRISRCDPLLVAWFLKGKSRLSAGVPLETTSAGIALRLEVNRRDVGGDLIAELGFSLGAWNGSDISLAATLGAFSPYVQNAVVLSFDGTLPTKTTREWRYLLDGAVEAFAPDHAVVTSAELLASAKAVRPWEAGLLTYDRGGDVKERGQR